MYRKTVLNNGATVITESLPYLSVLSIGLWWKGGSRYEKKENNGICHFIEHMLFKGTEKRSAYDIATEIDKIGGSIDAFTGKEYACLYGKILKRDLNVLLDVFEDMYFNSLFKNEDIEREKEVIKQEIKMNEDNPEEFIYDAFHAHFFKGHPLGMPILGRKENIEVFKREDLMEYYKKYYGVNNLIVTAVGKLDHMDFVSEIEKIFGRKEGEEVLYDLREPKNFNGINVIERDLEHVYLAIGMKGLSQKDVKRYALYILNAVMGGCQSSHLFQEIREKRGLVYNIYSYVNCFHDTGTFGITTSTSKEFLEDVLRLIKEEIRRIKEKGLTDEELSFSKKHIKGNLFLSLESSEARMGRLAKNEIYFGKYIPLKETIKEIEKIGKEEVNGVARTLLCTFEDMSITVLGNVEKERIEEIWRN